MIKYLKSKKGFIITELATIVSLIAIWGTIAYVSFDSQTSNARDSKRKTDLSSLSSKINVVNTTGIKFTDMIVYNPKYAPKKSIFLAWAFYKVWTGTLTDYLVWTINSNVLWININDFRDPGPNANYYPIWATDLKGGIFELASTLERKDENTSINNTLTIWNYYPRTISWSLSPWKCVNWIFSIINFWSWTFFPNDTISWVVKDNSKIQKISWNGLTLEFYNGWWCVSDGQIFIKMNESKSLIFNWWEPIWWTENIPYIP